MKRHRRHLPGTPIAPKLSVPPRILAGVADRDEGSHVGDRGFRGRDGGGAGAQRAGPCDNAAGRGVAFEAVRRRRGDDPAGARAWEVGARGERAAGQMLARLDAVGWWGRLQGHRSAWRVLHSVTIRNANGEARGDVDHLVIGPPGVVTINTKHHPRGRVVVDGDEVTVNGRRTAYVARSRREAERARSMLAAALAADGRSELGEVLRVHPLVLVVGTMPNVRREPDGVPVIALQRLLPTVTRLPTGLSPPQVEAVFAVARREGTWTIPA